MSQENVDRIRAGYRTLNRTGEVDALLSELHPNIEISVPGDALDYAGVVFHGHDGMREALGILTAAWSETKFEPLDVIDAGNRVLALCRQRSRGRHTALEVEQVVAHLWSVGNDGRLVRLEILFDLDAARNKLSEQDAHADS
jgi:ketosteroid isomerase-like protein